MNFINKPAATQPDACDKFMTEATSMVYTSMNVSLMIDCVTNTIKKLFAISCNIAKLVVIKTEYALSLFMIMMARWCLSR